MVAMLVLVHVDVDVEYYPHIIAFVKADVIAKVERLLQMPLRHLENAILSIVILSQSFSAPLDRHQ